MNNTGEKGRKISSYFFYLLSVIALAFGLLYLLRTHLMSYHIAFLGMTEDQIGNFNPRILELFLALIHIAGGVFITVGVCSFIVTYFSYRKGSIWSWWYLLLSFSISLIPMLIVTYSIAEQIKKGQPKPPWWLTLVMLVIMIAGLIIGWKSKSKKESEN